MTLLPLDEINQFRVTLEAHFGEDGKLRSKQDEEDIIDEMLDLFLLSAALGSQSANDDLGTDYHIGTKTAVDIIDREVAGKTWRERVREYFDNGGTAADIMRIAETEAHRDANESAFVTAEAVGAKTKTWHCLLLPTSRESHIYLNNVTAPIDGYFYSIHGGSTRFPGEWGIADEDVNCYCYCTFSKD